MHEADHDAGTERPVYLVSGGTGSSGELLVLTALAQFADRHVPFILIPRVRQENQIADVVARAQADGGLVAYTLVRPRLRRAMAKLIATHGVPAVDLMGPLLDQLSDFLDQAPVGRPGLYRQLNQAYFQRVAAIGFTMAHDDGLRPESLTEADLVILGLSRVGKSPLSMYLAVQGWKVANVPIVPGGQMPPELARVERRRLFGLTIDVDDLREHRRSRQVQMRQTLPPSYTDPKQLYAELEYASEVYRELGANVVDVTRKPIETSAEEIIAYLLPHA